ncbi:DMT family transporter [Thiomicrorhabdus cannonii]|uniref:DMT family transporter n=1 Tax=Thiomicrorhabdus cannonii TaxID=2748011 RepID=UPI0015BD8171|nr:DMT family transporter [Thiomicrorhabdus cannonii]
MPHLSRAALFQTALFTFLSMVAFATNAIVCRWALDGQLIDPVSFTNLRLGSAAAMLFLVMLWMSRRQSNTVLRAEKTTHASRGSWRSAVVLFVYAITFSYGYVAISTANGALILAVVVQLTMIVYGVRQGHKLHAAEWIGVALALFGLLYLVYPKLSTPSWWGLVMVVISAYTWALYSLYGRKSLDPLRDTAFNFYRTLPLVALATVVSLFFLPNIHFTAKGIGLALFSGAVTSGLGYILWYKALTNLSPSMASTSQLLVPLLAAVGANWLLAEPITLRFILAALLMLGGIGLVIIGRNQHRKAVLQKTNAG